MKHQALFSLKDKSKKLKCRLLQFLFGTLMVNAFSQFNPFLTSELVHPYHLDESILVLGVSGECFHFHCIFHKKFCKQTL